MDKEVGMGTEMRKRVESRRKMRKRANTTRKIIILLKIGLVREVNGKENEKKNRRKKKKTIEWTNEERFDRSFIPVIIRE